VSFSLPCGDQAIDCWLCNARDDLSEATNWLMQSEKAPMSQMSLLQAIINQAILIVGQPPQTWKGSKRFFFLLITSETFHQEIKLH